MNAMQTITQTLQKTGAKICYRFRLLFFVLTTICTSSVLTAQQFEYIPADYQGQWFIGMGLGPRIYFADHARQLAIIDRLSLGADIFVGKWWGPVLGTRLGGSFQTLKGATLEENQRISHAIPGTGFNIRDGESGMTRLYKQQFDAWNLYADLMFNVSNLFEGIYEDRFWTLVPYAGIGYLSTWDHPKANEISLNVGLLNSLRVGYAVDLNFDIRGAMVRDRFHTISEKDMGGRPFDGILSVNVGVTFRFGGTSQPRTVYRPESVSQVPPVREPVVVEKVIEWKDIATDVLILFRINESVLLRDARVQLGFLARLMHQYPEGTYTITGYADEGTGNPDLNQRLSRARAERVKECLVGEFGVSPTRLQTVAAGGIENRYYNDPSLSRSVIIRPNKY